MSLRVLRLLEYTYPNVEAMESDMGKWAIPANGIRTLGMGQGKAIKSATLPLEVLADIKEETQ